MKETQNKNNRISQWLIVNAVVGGAAEFGFQLRILAGQLLHNILQLIDFGFVFVELLAQRFHLVL